jgi:hypothetical protein
MFTMCKVFIYNPSPILFNVDNIRQKFVNKILYICDVLIGLNQIIHG